MLHSLLARSRCILVFRSYYVIGLLVLLGYSPLWAQRWVLLGPDGGDARSLAYDPSNPDHIFVGTTTGSIFSSINRGQSWSPFAHLGNENDYVIDHILIDPRNSAIMFVAAWNVRNQASGDVFRSQDGGTTWLALPGMHEKSIRALAMAASDSSVLVSGARDGVYRTKDGGDTWQRISPDSYTEIKNIESIAIDPKDPNLVYAGTWHLAWKTINGGITWQHLNQGIIDDSDVFSIVVDPTSPSTVYASACSGIYKSYNAGIIFHKVQGIPFSARRTRILRQDPSNPRVVYAGTTQGLWKTMDGGRAWRQMTNSDIVVNDVLVDPTNSARLLLATDRGGVMVSNNAGISFLSSNHGYTHRYVTTIVPDTNDPGTVFVGIANDRQWGGVFSFHERGGWQQRSAGLGGRDVLALKQTANGDLIAGTNHGVFFLDHKRSAWRPLAGSAVNFLMNLRVNDVELASDRWLLATSAGLFISTDKGRSWNGGPVLGRTNCVSVHSAKRLLVAATPTELLVSSDGGMNWLAARLPAQLTRIRSLAVTPGSEIWLTGQEGAFRSSDAGKTWHHILNGLPQSDLSSISYDQSAKTLLATTLSSGVVFLSPDGGRSWERAPDSGYPLHRITVAHGRLVAATPFDGVIMQK